MAEPIGFFINIDIEEDNVKKLLNQKFKEAKFGGKLGYYFSELLYGSFANTTESIFVFNYNKKKQTCFIAYLMNHFTEDDFALLPKVLEIINGLKKTEHVKLCHSSICFI